MNAKILTLAIAMLSLGIAATTAGLSTVVYAEEPADPNCFGDDASDLAGAGTTDKEDNEMGEHSQEGSDFTGDAPFDGDDKKGRSGIGNIGEDAGLTDSKHPSDLAEELAGDCDVEEEDN